MPTDPRGPSRIDLPGLLEELAGCVVGIGLITMVVFPFAIPMILLIAAVVIPLLLVGMAVGVIGLVLIGPAVYLRRWRQQRRSVATESLSRGPRAASVRTTTEMRLH